LGATLAAFGGESWIKGSLPAIKRITVRGWLTIFFAIAAFILGVFKELILHNEQKNAEAKFQELLSSNKRQEETIVAQLDELKSLRINHQRTNDELIDLKNRVVKITPSFANGYFELLKDGGAEIIDVDFEVFTVIYAKRSNFAAVSSGQLPRYSKSGVLFQINIQSMWESVKSWESELKAMPDVSIDESINRYLCARFKFEDEYGANYTRYLSLRVFSEHQPRKQDMLIGKQPFEECLDDYNSLKKEPKTFMEFWRTGNKSTLVQKLRNMYRKDAILRSYGE